MSTLTGSVIERKRPNSKTGLQTGRLMID